MDRILEGTSRNRTRTVPATGASAPAILETRLPHLRRRRGPRRNTAEASGPLLRLHSDRRILLRVVVIAIGAPSTHRLINLNLNRMVVAGTPEVKVEGNPVKIIPSLLIRQGNLRTTRVGTPATMGIAGRLSTCSSLS